MVKKIINTANAPAPIGPYNQAVFAGDMLFISGQICIDPASGDLKNGSIEEETHQVMQNLKAVLVAAGMSFKNAVKTTIFITDMNQFAVINGIYGKYFEDEGEATLFPARETVQVSVLPKSVNVEISMIAVQ